MSGKDFDTMARTLARMIDKSGPDFAVLLTKYSTEIQQNFKMSPEQTAALISGTGTSDETWAKYRRAFNKTFGFNNIASAKKVKLARRENLPIERNDWEECVEMLYKSKQGKEKRKQTKTHVLKVRNLPDYLQKVANSEAKNLSNLSNGDILKVCYDADAGGGRFVAEFTFLNVNNETIVLHPFIIYEGTDVRPNLEVVMSSFIKQIKHMEGMKIKVGQKELYIEQYGMFDLCALNCIVGKQNHSATFPDVWTNVTLKHLQNHKMMPHTPRHCKDIYFLSMNDYDTNITHHSQETGEIDFL